MTIAGRMPVHAADVRISGNRVPSLSADHRRHEHVHDVYAQVRSHPTPGTVGKVQQDYLRRVLLREREQPGGAAPALIDQTVRFCLDHGYQVLLDGILAASSHSEMISGLLRAHRGRSFVFYLDACFEETLRRHATRPQAAEFSGEDMRSWYLARDLLGVDGERVVPEHFTLTRTVAFIGTITGLLAPAAPSDRPTDPDPAPH
jgi:hypothetical protein